MMIRDKHGRYTKQTRHGVKKDASGKRIISPYRDKNKEYVHLYLPFEYVKRLYDEAASQDTYLSTIVYKALKQYWDIKD